MVLSRKILFALVALVVGALCAVLGAKINEHLAARNYLESYYMDRATDAEWNITLLTALREKRYSDAIGYHEQLLHNNLIVLSQYPTASPGKFGKKISEILSEASTYRKKNPRQESDRNVNEAIEKALTPRRNSP